MNALNDSPRTTEPLLVCTPLSRYAQQALAADPALAARMCSRIGVASPARPGPGGTSCALAIEPCSTSELNARLVELRNAALTDSGNLNAEPDAILSRSLRQLRREVFLTAMEADLRGSWDVDHVTETMTALAEVCIRHACQTHFELLAAQYGCPRNAAGAAQPLLVIGMGKLGGRELNVSSDIDLIFLYPEDGETDGKPGSSGNSGRSLSNSEFFTRLGRKVIGMLSESTEDGYVFRVDMRLRPNGDSGPLVASLGMLETYFFVQGREWERYAWIKARIVAAVGAPDRECLQAERDTEALRAPFVFRKYLDFGAIGAIRDLQRQIRAEVAKRNAAHPERALNVKLGRGGIREIEFIAQVFQLIRGGRQRRLQTRATCEVLRLLGSLGMLSEAIVNRLIAHYRFLRALEHRLQYLDDAQTHAVPLEPEDRERLARMLACSGDWPVTGTSSDISRDAPSARDADAMLAYLGSVQADVAEVFDHIFDPGSRVAFVAPTVTHILPRAAALGQRAVNDKFIVEALLDDAGLDAARADLEARGFNAASEIAQRYAALARSPRIRSLPESSKQRLGELMEPMLACVQAQSGAEAQAHLARRFADLFEAIARRSAYLSLLSEYPVALHRVAQVLASSPWAAQYLTQHPLLLDELLDNRENTPHPDWQVVRMELSQAVAESVLTVPRNALTDHSVVTGAPDVERQMDLLREAQHMWTFRLLAKDLAGQLSVESLADDLSALADLILETTMQACWHALPKRHRDEPRFAIAAYGKHGGKELGYSSDLDLVFLYDDDDERAAEVYARYAQRLLSWLTSTTSAGRLYDIDMRLRPNGNAGLLATSLASFERYQHRLGANAAWVWEHQALTRARWCAGHAEVGNAFEDIRRQVLQQARDRAPLLAEILAMRKRIHDGHPNPGRDAPLPVFDLKHDEGGMIDVEFIVQALVLLHCARLPELADDAGNIALLLRAARHGLLPESLAQDTADAYRRYRAAQHALRLAADVDGGPARVPDAEFQPERDTVRAAWAHVFAT
jgi:glutamate-ammonia-ligase adenylyltransferase